MSHVYRMLYLRAVVFEVLGHDGNEDMLPAERVGDDVQILKHVARRTQLHNTIQDLRQLYPKKKLHSGGTNLKSHRF